MQPGDYIDAAAVYGGCNLILNGAGKYYFNDLTVFAGANLAIDHTGGAVEIYVRNDISWGGTVSSLGGRPFAHVLTYLGTSRFRVLNNPFNGTIVAPNATLEMFTNNYHGAYYARDLIVHQNSSVIHEPCQG